MLSNRTYLNVNRPAKCDGRRRNWKIIVDTFYFFYRTTLCMYVSNVCLQCKKTEAFVTEITSVLPIAGKKFSRYFEGCLKIFAVFEHFYFIYSTISRGPLTMFCGTLVGKHCSRATQRSTQPSVQWVRGAFLRGLSDQGEKLSTNIHLLPRLRGIMPPLPHLLSWCAPVLHLYSARDTKRVLLPVCNRNK